VGPGSNAERLTRCAWVGSVPPRGFRTSHEVSKIEEISDDDLRALISEDAIYAHRERRYLVYQQLSGMKVPAFEIEAGNGNHDGEEESK
jgi:hypothetical protein